MIAGLYPYTRAGVRQAPRVTLAEIPASLVTNPSYRKDLVVLAGDRASADQLEGFGLRVRRVFDDAPPGIHRDAAHKRKHWMCRWALAEFGEFLWVDWDTVLLRPPDDAFWAWCRAQGTPKFIRIPGYWATVNCGVYYAGRAWAEAMDRSFSAEVREPNDELLWKSVLPVDVETRTGYWWGQRVVHVWMEHDMAAVGSEAYFCSCFRKRTLRAHIFTQSGLFLCIDRGACRDKLEPGERVQVLPHWTLCDYHGKGGGGDGLTQGTR
jgi:hypothetical protein